VTVTAEDAAELRAAVEKCRESRAERDAAKQELYAYLRSARSVATVRELAEASGLSFQRVHQIVGTGTGASPATHLYFAEHGNLIKIGVTSNVEQRMKELKTTLLLAVEHPEPTKLEGQLHGSLAAHRVRGEWFSAHGEVLAAMDTLRP
jgi:hypothetical protein